MGGSGPSEAALESALARLVETGVVDERPDGTLVTTEEFEATRRVYRDTYADADDDRFRRTVAETFGVSENLAAERVDDGAVTREDLVATLSLRAVLDETDDERLATMATLVGEITPASPVPDRLDELGDGEWEAFLEDHPDAVVTVWRRDCAPCDALKGDLDAVVDALPEAVALGGVDGESVPAFRRAFDVDTAPAVCCFRGGALETVVTGRESPSRYAEAFADCF
jgi:hypothetical protein